MSSHKKRLGELLVEKGILTPEQLDYALRFQQRGNKFLGQILISTGLSSETEVYKALSELLHVDFVNLRACFDSPAGRRTCPENSRRHSRHPAALCRRQLFVPGVGKSSRFRCDSNRRV